METGRQMVCEAQDERDPPKEQVEMGMRSATEELGTPKFRDQKKKRLENK